MSQSEDIKEIKLLANKLGRIFNKANNKLCCNCPDATCDTVEEANKGIEKKEYSIQSKEAGCCSNCSYAKGYFKRNSVPNYNPQFYDLTKKYDWDNKYGFFDNHAKSCRLPREWRSQTCLIHVCKHMEKDILKFLPKRLGIRRIVYKISNLKRQCGLLY